MSNWEPINQETARLDELGAELNIRIRCPIRYCAYQYGKPMFECRCGMVFPRFAIEGAMTANDWTGVKKRHNGR